MMFEPFVLFILFIIALIIAFALGYAASAANQLEVRRKEAEQDRRKLYDRNDSDRRDFMRTMERFEERMAQQRSQHINDYHTTAPEGDTNDARA